MVLGVSCLAGRLAAGGFFAGVFAGALPLLTFFYTFARFATAARWVPLPPFFLFGGITAGVALSSRFSKRIFGLGLDCRRRGVKGIIGISLCRMDRVIGESVIVRICPSVAFSRYLLTLKVFFHT